MKDNKNYYRSFLLRFWHEDAAGIAPWRFVVVEPYTKVRWGFTEVEQLTKFIYAQICDLEDQKCVTTQPEDGEKYV